MCSSSRQECSLMAQYHLERFDKSFAGAYREHVFLSHDLVPDAIRNSQTDPYYIATDTADSQHDVTAQRQDTDNARVLTPKNKSLGATPQEIQQWFGDVNASVLVFHSLYGAFAGFDGQSVEYKSITARLANALKPCNYRQLKFCAGGASRDKF